MFQLPSQRPPLPATGLAEVSCDPGGVFGSMVKEYWNSCDKELTDLTLSVQLCGNTMVGDTFEAKIV